ncbi:hypothetical protein BJ875DRAFT_404589 [Amylocarpus encephaloides]|uniref:SIS domain-containing protein n=1 Tax=Amylocarpus encephaloides TaxID=45428 RepID=A0A9P8C516_9HELO|nr:hypothetical protein BJ875DRAFT_404589 [Amylocarpus encephaloides]
MTHDHNPIKNSEVYVLQESQHCPAIPPPSPPSPSTPGEEVPDFIDILETGLNVLRTESAALAQITTIYESNTHARNNFEFAVKEIVTCNTRGGKIVIIGIGKSGHIGKKLEATFNSLSMGTHFMQASEGLHGDLGVIHARDVILFISNSGKTPEILGLLPHLQAKVPGIPAIIITEARTSEACELIKQKPGTILLSAPMHMSEEAAFGVKAPTTSIILALAIGHALAITSGKVMHGISLCDVFHKNHPGGAIGATIEKAQMTQKVSDRAIPIMDIPEVSCNLAVSRVGLMMFQSQKGWARIRGDHVVPPRRMKAFQMDNNLPIMSAPGLLVPRSQWHRIPADFDIAEAQQFVNLNRRAHGREQKFADDEVLVIIEDGEMCGVLEIGDLMAEA